MIHSPVVIICLILSSAMAACSRQPATATASSRAPSATTPPGVPAGPPAMQTSHTRPSEAGPRTVTGTVLETMNAANYTYVRVKTNSGDLWAATSQFDVKVGERVTVPLEMAMENFHSKALNRDFPVIYFVSHVAREGEAVPAMASGASLHGTTPSTPAEAEAVAEPMQPPAGGATVASVWANRASLVGKAVTVRGKVVKYNGAILGVNWLHIQDGTGAADRKTNDLAITTTDTAKVGDIVTATGTIAIDKDFGSGYTYAVILERSTIKR